MIGHVLDDLCSIPVTGSDVSFHRCVLTGYVISISAIETETVEFWNEQEREAQNSRDPIGKASDLYSGSTGSNLDRAEIRPLHCDHYWSIVLWTATKFFSLFSLVRYFKYWFSASN